jgi:hypothetical protein
MAAGLAALTLLIAPGAGFAQPASHGAPRAAARTQSQTPGTPTEEQSGTPDVAPGLPVNGAEVRTTATSATPVNNDTLTRLNDRLTSVDVLTKVGVGLAVAALLMALVALGLTLWLRFMSALRAITDQRSLEEALRQLIRAELRTVEDGRVAGLVAEINRLKERLAQLEIKHQPDLASQTQSAAPPRPSGPAPIAADFHRLEPRDNRPQQARAVTEPTPPPQTVHEPATRLRSRPVDNRPGNHERAIEVLKDEADYRRLMEDYGRCLAGDRGALAAFVADHHPVGIAEEDKGRFLETDDPDPTIWYVEVSGSDSYGILLPARRTMRDWDKSYRHMGGMKAKALFGSIYEILAGERLSVSKPAWAYRRGGSVFELVARGELVGG